MRPAAQEMQLPQPVSKTRWKQNNKQKPKVAIEELLHANQVCVRLNGHLALASIDLQTLGGDLICTQFVYVYQVPVVEMEPTTLGTAIKASKATIDKTCDIHQEPKHLSSGRV